LGVSATLNSVLIPSYGLVGAAIATTASMMFGVVAAAAYLGFKFGALILPVSAFRITACSAIIYAASRGVAPSSRLSTMIQLIALSVVYVLALVVTRELRRDDLRLVARVFRG